MAPRTTASGATGCARGKACAAGPTSAKSYASQLQEALSANAVRVIDLFREWDSDGSGGVTLKEFRRAMPLLGLEATAAEGDALYASWDADGSGLIEVKELQRLLRRGQTMELDVSVASARQIQEQARARAAAG